jgi:proteasome accessory factor C
MTYASDDWMTRLVLGFGSDVQVVEPEALARRVRDAATTAIEAYRAVQATP